MAPCWPIWALVLAHLGAMFDDFGPMLADLDRTLAKLAPTWSQLGPNWAQTWLNLKPKWNQDGLKLDLKWACQSTSSLNRPKCTRMHHLHLVLCLSSPSGCKLKQIELSFWQVRLNLASVCILLSIWPNLSPTWPNLAPTCSQDGSQILAEAKINK